MPQNDLPDPAEEKRVDVSATPETPATETTKETVTETPAPQPVEKTTETETVTETPDK